MNSEEKVNILLVDDQPGHLLSLEAILDLPDYRLATAHSGEAALKRLLKEDFAIILLDVKMPDLDGFETAKLIKERADSKHIPIIFLTGVSQEEQIFKGYSVGAVDYIIKPFNPFILKSKVAALADLYKKSRRLLQAEEASRLKSEFVSNISDALRNPLNAIIGYGSLIADEVYGVVPDKLAAPLEGIQRNANDLLILISEVLDHAKSESDKMTLSLSKVDVPSLIQEVLVGAEPLFEKKSLFVKFDRRQACPNIESDAVKIKQMIRNFLVNALKFTKQGGVSISTKDLPERQGIEFAIQDTGVGVKPEDLSKIFDAFHQVDATATREFGGMGLGLTIVKELIHLLKGDVRIESEYEKGSTFTVFLPYFHDRNSVESRLMIR